MRRNSGSVLIFSLWVLIILAILSITVSRYASTDIKLARHEAFNIKATYLVRAGIIKMMAEIANDTNSYDSLGEDWHRTKDNPKKLVFKSDQVLYGASDEDAKLNLNSPFFQSIHLARLGLEDGLAKNIIDYRDKKANKSFEFMEELFLVEGMASQHYSIIKEYIAIYRGIEPRVNINTACEKVLQALLGNPFLVQEILQYRKGEDGKEFTEDDIAFKDPSDIGKIEGLDASLFSIKSYVFRIWAESFFSDDKNVFKSAVAIIDRSGKIYNWKEY